MSIELNVYWPNLAKCSLVKRVCWPNVQTNNVCWLNVHKSKKCSAQVFIELMCVGKMLFGQMYDDIMPVCLMSVG
jgi:hypothetical protein